jgi:hypothetical protein
MSSSTFGAESPRSPKRLWSSAAHPRAGGIGSSTLEGEHELALILAEPPGGQNFGYRRTRGRGESLNFRDWIRDDYLRSGGWSSCTRHGSGTGRGRPKTIEEEWLTPTAIAAVEERVGVTRSEFHTVVRKGRMTLAQREQRELIARKIRSCIADGAAVSPLAGVLGCSPQTLWRLVRK